MTYAALNEQYLYNFWERNPKFGGKVGVLELWTKWTKYLYCTATKIDMFRRFVCEVTATTTATLGNIMAEHIAPIRFFSIHRNAQLLFVFLRVLD